MPLNSETTPRTYIDAATSDSRFGGFPFLFFLFHRESPHEGGGARPIGRGFARVHVRERNKSRGRGCCCALSSLRVHMACSSRWRLPLVLARVLITFVGTSTFFCFVRPSTNQEATAEPVARFLSPCSDVAVSSGSHKIMLPALSLPGRPHARYATRPIVSPWRTTASSAEGICSCRTGPPRNSRTAPAGAVGSAGGASRPSQVCCCSGRACRPVPVALVKVVVPCDWSIPSVVRISPTERAFCVVNPPFRSVLCERVERTKRKEGSEGGSLLGVLRAAHP